MASKTVDLYLIYQFLKRLTKPFKEWDAYKLGVIDDKGKILIPRKNRNSEQIRSFLFFDVLVCNLKKLIEKLGGQSKIVSYASALFLVKEYIDLNTEEHPVIMENEQMSPAAMSRYYIMVNHIAGEDIVNAAGTGNYAGLGIGDQGEPPGPKAKLGPIFKRKKKDIP